jgi:CopG family nickel-responsive transcriptional regulator
MADLARVTISLEEPLLAAFDKLIAARGYANRSEAIRDLIRDRLVREQGEAGAAEQVAIVSIVYDHHARELAAKLIDKQHHHHDLVISTLHVHLGTDHCLEVSILRGPGKKVRQLADDILTTRGVLHGEVSFTSGDQAFRNWSGGDGHAHSHSHGS